MNPPEVRVRLLHTAEDDLADLLSFIAVDNPAAAEALLSKFTKNLLLLSQHPRLGRMPEDEWLARLGYRYLVIDNYLVFYTLEGNTCSIHRIIHGARDYPPLFS